MHELSIVYDVIDIIKTYADKHHMRHITQVTMTIGEFCTVQEDCLQFAFENLSKGSICEKAILSVNKLQAKAYCEHCKQDFKISFIHKICPSCQKLSEKITTGYEILVTSIEGDSCETSAD